VFKLLSQRRRQIFVIRLNWFVGDAADISFSWLQP